MKAPHLEITGQEGWSGREEGSRLSPFCLSCSDRRNQQLRAHHQDNGEALPPPAGHQAIVPLSLRSVTFEDPKLAFLVFLEGQSWHFYALRVI